MAMKNPPLQNRSMNLKTQSIKYIGSKKNILGKILKIISVLASKEKIVSILDGFSGSTSPKC